MHIVINTFEKYEKILEKEMEKM